MRSEPRPLSSFSQARVSSLISGYSPASIARGTTTRLVQQLHIHELDMCLPEARLCHKSPRKHGRRQCPRILSRASRRPDDCRFQIPCLLLATRLTFCPSLSICPSWRRFRFCAEALSTPAGLRPERLPRRRMAPMRVLLLLLLFCRLQLGPSFRSPLVPCCYHLLASNPAGRYEKKRQHTSRTHRPSSPWLSMGMRHCVTRGRHDSGHPRGTLGSDP